jgi:Protein of unknown function (DUF2510)
MVAGRRADCHFRYGSGSLAAMTTTTTTKKPGPGLILSLVVILLGTVIGIGGLAKGVSSVVHDIHGVAVKISPNEVHRHLDTGTWEIYAARGSEGLTPSDVTVTGPDGSSIPTRGLGSHTSENVTTGGRTYDGQVEFTVSQSGLYDVKVAGDPGTPFLLSKSLGDLVKHAARWFAVMGVGILLGLIGVVMLIVGIVRRHRVNRPAVAGGGYPVATFAGSGPGATYGGAPATAPAPTPSPASSTPPPGWYPDPSIANTSRWWDGTRWTDQTHPTG